MDKIYEQAKDLHIVATYIYMKSETDGKAYVDAECTKLYAPSELEEVFKKGALIYYANQMQTFKPVSFYNPEVPDQGVVNYIDMTGDVKSLSSAAIYPEGFDE